MASNSFFTLNTIAIMNDDQWYESVFRNITIAVVIMFGINNIHPFQDGNWRTAKIFMIIVLKRLLRLPIAILFM